MSSAWVETYSHLWFSQVFPVIIYIQILEKCQASKQHIGICKFISTEKYKIKINHTFKDTRNQYVFMFNVYVEYVRLQPSTMLRNLTYKVITC
jgi:hypothetical protein